VDRAEDLLVRRGLPHVAQRARPDHGQNALSVLDRGQREHPRGRAQAGDLGRRPRPAAGHPNVEQGHIGEPPGCEIDGALRVLRRPDDLERGVGSDHAHQRLADGLFVVRDQHPDPIHLGPPVRADTSST
jgi:hypothetical protein